ncbi:MAG TPA: HAD-IA family hydrolase [Candidatus Onthomonas avicola]|nr:HAD-IA family hydrolase [Candidatus Onthomonas avicola]
MAYNTVIFDMDGTVLNTLDDLAAAVNAALAHAGLPPVTLEKVRASVGNGVLVLMDQMLPWPREDARYQEVAAWYRRYYAAHNLIETKPYPGILDLLEQLRRRGVTMAVVSNKPDEAVGPLSRHFFGDYMAVSMGEHAGLRRKPYPDMVQEVLRRLGKTPAECLYVGDSEVDRATAENAGLDCASVTWGFRDRAQLAALGPKFLLDRPEELLAVFDRD